MDEEDSVAVENYESDDMSEIDDALPSAVRIFRFIRESIPNQDENSSEAETESFHSEEQQSVEIISSSSSSSDPDEQTRTLPCEHQYLGELEQVRGRIIMDDGSVHKIPLLFPTSPVTLVPGQTIPLMENDDAVNVLKYAVETNHIFGIISPRYWHDTLCNAIGTTAEIYEYALTENGYKIKAKGRQRFKILRVTPEFINNRYVTFAFIKILPEISLKPIFDGAQLLSLNKFRTSQRLKCLRREVSQMRWPIWLYKNYDEKYLIQKVKKKIAEQCSRSQNIALADDAATLSFQLLKLIPVPEKMILEAMELNSAIQRLRWIISILDSQINKLKCYTCKKTIGFPSDIFAMSAEGPHGTYVNLQGYVHELITLKNAKNVFVSGNSETEYSWFPGYAWSILTCKSCQYHIGWKFTACKKDASPKEFWGVKNNSIYKKYDKLSAPLH